MLHCCSNQTVNEPCLQLRWEPSALLCLMPSLRLLCLLFPSSHKAFPRPSSFGNLPLHSRKEKLQFKGPPNNEVPMLFLSINPSWEKTSLAWESFSKRTRRRKEQKHKPHLESWAGLRSQGWAQTVPDCSSNQESTWKGGIVSEDRC